MMSRSASLTRHSIRSSTRHSAAIASDLAQQHQLFAITLPGLPSFAAIRNEFVALINHRAVERHVSASDVLEDVFLDYDGLLEDLYTAAEFERRTARVFDVSETTQAAIQDNNSTLSQRRNRTVPQVEFRKAIIGSTTSYPCRKILATLFQIDIQANSSLWAGFVKHLRLDDRQMRSHEFSDAKLPFSDEDVVRYFGSQHATTFREQQFHFCRPDMRSHFATKLEELRNIIDLATVYCSKQCKIKDCGGCKEPIVDECPAAFISDLDLSSIVSDHRGLLESLHLEAFKSTFETQRNFCPRAQWDALERAKTEAARFYDGLQSRNKVLATFALINVSPQSQAWHNFTNMCLGEVSSEKMMTDDDLPLKLFGDWERYFGSSRSTYDCFMNMQRRFCAIRLKRDSQVEAKDDCPLPISRVIHIGEGSFGQVHEVNVKAGYLTDTDCRLAMKVTEPDKHGPNEWASAECFFKQPLEHKGVMRAVASIKTPTRVYIFFPLAKCNLYDFIQGRVDTLSMPLDSFEDKKRMLGRLIVVAEALRYLHYDLKDAAQWKSMECVQQDLKLENILVHVDEYGNISLQITDFGISSIKLCQRDLQSQDTVHRNGLFRHGKQSRRSPGGGNMLGDNMPNSAPEGLHDDMISTATDVWAFGTVCVEFIAWLSGGPTAFKDFEQARRGQSGSNDDRSFSVDPDTDEPVLKENIRDWFQRLIQGTANQKERCLYEDMWMLIERSLLVCDPGKRANMHFVCKALHKIFGGERLELNDVCQLRQRVSQESRVSSARTGNSISLQNPSSESAPEGPMLQGESSGISRSWLGRMFKKCTPLEKLSADIENGREQDLPKVLKSISKAELNQRLRGKTILEQAFEEGSDRMVIAIINAGGDMAPLENQSQPLLHRAARRGLAMTTELLLKDDRRRSSLNSGESTPLHLALKNRHGSVANILLREGSNISFSGENGETALHYAVTCSSESLVRGILRKWPQLVRAKNDERQSALHVCALYAETGFASHHARLLLDHNAAVNLEDRHHRTPLYYATEQLPNENRTNMAQLLLDRGAKVDGSGELRGPYWYRYDCVDAAVKESTMKSHRDR